MNSYKIEIKNSKTNNWEDYSKYAVFPLKIGELLDERLDEIELQLQLTNDSYILPLTQVRITVTTQTIACYNIVGDIRTRCDNPSQYAFTHNDDKTVTVEKVYNMLVANDVAAEKPIGSGKYCHQLYLIELTKLAEGYIGDSITFTNSLLSSPKPQNVVFTLNYGSFIENEPSSDYKSPVTRNSSVLVKGNPLDFLTELFGITIAETFFKNGDGVYITDEQGNNIYKQYLYLGNVYHQYLDNDPVEIATGWNWQNETVYFKTEGVLSIKYIYQHTPMTGEGFFIVVPSLLSPKKWTITDVLVRICETVSPIRVNERPLFRLEGVEYSTNITVINGVSVGQQYVSGYTAGSLAEELNKIIAPEFSFTKMTLREMLQQVGGYIHGEPRITGEKVDSLGFTYYEITYDKYGQTKESKIKSLPYVSIQNSTDVNNYCTALDSSADNLVNSLNYAQGVVIEPFNNGYKTLRTETLAVRLEENNALIQTFLPIFKIFKVSVMYNGTRKDITPYVYELTEYNNLSSYRDVYPYSKATAIYYEQGSKNLKGLFFKNENAVSPVFSKYAISNILSLVTGQAVDFNITDYERLSFQVQYLPFYSERIKTHKSYVIEGAKRTISYSQSANAIESNFYGENLKGVIARLGNVEKSVTLLLSVISDVPQLGYKYDGNYYISAITTEIMPFGIKCTLGLSKDFNKLSEYVGINSNKRMWEISERQTQSRQTVIQDFALIKEKSENDTESSTNTNIVERLCDIYFGSYDSPISMATVKGKNKALEDLDLYSFALPVVSSAFGNSLTFSFGYADNYSAGENISDNRYSSYVPYTDYFGRIYYLDFNIKTITSATYSPNELPIDTTTNEDSKTVFSTNNYPLLLRKDNREIPSFTYELTAVTSNDENAVIIGSGLSYNSSLVNNSPRKLSLYAFNNEINVIDSTVDLSSARLIQANYTITDDEFDLPNYTNSNFKAWAIVTTPETVTVTCSDDNGNSTTQELYQGGELVLGQNKGLNGQTIVLLKKHKI